jgi:hypothetical protein
MNVLTRTYITAWTEPKSPSSVHTEWRNRTASHIYTTSLIHESAGITRPHEATIQPQPTNRKSGVGQTESAPRLRSEPAPTESGRVAGGTAELTWAGGWWNSPAGPSGGRETTAANLRGEGEGDWAHGAEQRQLLRRRSLAFPLLCALIASDFSHLLLSLSPPSLFNWWWW